MSHQPDKWELGVIHFWSLKHAIDDEVNRVGWSVERCKVYILQRYHVQSRLAMTDDQLSHLLAHLKRQPDRVLAQNLLNKDKRKKRRKY
jgi:hypothetical protein